MKKVFPLFSFVLIVSALVLAACGSAKPTEEKDTSGGADQVPAQYASLKNPLEGKSDAAAAGKTLYATNCASCHGEKGIGDGAAGASLNPKPGNLVEVAKDDPANQIFWRLSEGGAMAPFNSSMAAWKDTLSETERWQLVTYIQTLK